MRLSAAIPALLLALAAAPAASAASIPRFTEFGWLSPPPDLTDDASVAQYAGAGFDLMLPAWRDSGRIEDTRVRLDLAAAHGLRALPADRRLRRVNPQDPATYGSLDSVVADLSPLPAMLGYYLGDEPTADRFRQIGEFAALLAARDPAHISWNNLLGRGAFATRAEWIDYTSQYVQVVRPSVLCNDQYDLRKDGDRGLLVENVAGLAELARGAAIPFWGVIQLIEHGPYRAPTDGELRWQVATWLAYGARGIGWFTYWTPDFDPRYDWQPAMTDTIGQPTALYARVRAIAAGTRTVGLELAGTAWQRTTYAGSAPAFGEPFAPDGLVTGVEGRIALSAFRDSLGRDVRLVANSDSLAAQEVALRVSAAAPSSVERLDPVAGAWWPAPVTEAAGGPEVRLTLAAGDFALVRFTAGAAGEPRLVARPNPARGVVGWFAPGAPASARIVLRDARGGLVRTLIVPSDGTPLWWRGERDDGGFAPPGVYFARLGDGARAAVCRIAWSPGR